MRFRSKSIPTGARLAREQKRLILIVLGIGVLIFVARVMFSTDEAAPSTLQGQRTADGQRRRPLADDEVFVRTDAADPRTEVRTRLDLDAVRRLQNDQGKSADRLPGIPEAVLRPVMDDVMGIASEEHAAFALSIRLTARMSEDEKARAETGSYPLFQENPDWCRGRAWKLRGKLRRLSQTRADVDSYGLRSLYDCWISTTDSGNQLIHVIAVKADPSLPLDEFRGKDAPEIELTGYYFKREGYLREGDDGLGEVGLTPLLLTQSIDRWTPDVKGSMVAEELTPWLGWGALFISVAVVFMFWAFYHSDRGFRSTRTHQLTLLPAVSPFGDNDLQVQTVQDMLKQMEFDARDEALT